MSAYPGNGLLFGEPAGTYLQVALNTPVRRQFSYSLPTSMGSVEEGMRVKVPFGQRSMVGVVVHVDPHPPANVPIERIRDVYEVLDELPLLTPALLRLGRTIADDSYCSWGNVLAAMLPAALRKNRPRRTVPVVELAAEKTLDKEAMDELAKRYPKQEKALAYLAQAGGPVDVRQFLNRTGLSKSPLDTLAKKGLVRFTRRQDVLDPFAGSELIRDKPHELTPQQKFCVDQLVHAQKYQPGLGFLLFGITGSGKTEVYLRALEESVAQERGAIVLVPEISLTPQTVSRFRARFGEVAVLHSGLTDAERHDQWAAIYQGRIQIVVGARSALFAPVQRLGLIIVDEEHETSFKQESVPRYHAREVALERARLEGAIAVLGSATPSLESWYAAHQDGGLKLLELPDRVAGGSLPPIQLVDLRQEKPEQGHWMVLSSPLKTAMEQALLRGEKAILFLNRRGYAPAWQCRSCGTVVQCGTCDVPVTFHKWRRRAVCHMCMGEFPEPGLCPECKASQVQLVGVGTERAEEAVQRMLPQARLGRMDRDTMIRRESYEEVLEAFGGDKLDVLLGTQMVAKGLDFPTVTVVGVLNADTALHQPDFRAAERCFNLIAQVSGRAGRSERGGKVIVQTFLPEHPAVRHAAAHDYRSFAREELAERRMFGYPPYSHALRITFEAPELAKVEQMAQNASTLLRAIPAPHCEFLGPAPPPVEKVRSRFRRQILIKAKSKLALEPLRTTLFDLCQKQGIVVDRL
ncbi:MAG: primosomal protein N' [Planctomycetes bacterium]|nr:primosomal protein N' [Planctomycetota bacterium]